MASSNTFTQDELDEAHHDRERVLRLSHALLGIPLPKQRYKTFETPATSSTAGGQEPSQDFEQPRYGRMYSKSASNPVKVPVVMIKGDSGSDYTFIHPELVRQHQMDIKIAKNPIQVRDFNNTIWGTDQYIDGTLNGSGPQSMQHHFWLAPEACPVQAVIVGKDFIKVHGNPENLLSDREPGDMFVLISDSTTVSEKADIEKLRVERDRKRQAVRERAKQASAQATSAFCNNGAIGDHEKSSR